MKTVSLISILFMTLIACTAYAQSPISAKPSEFAQSKEWNKVGPRLQALWLSALKENFSSQEKVRCFVRVRAPYSRGDKSFLISSGFSVQLFSGTIARGRMNIKDLPNVASLPFVESIKLATK